MALSTNRTLITQTGINTHQVLNVGGLDSAGIATFLNFKTGESNVHSIGFDVVSSAGAGATIRSTGNAAFSGIVTAQKFVGDISQATGGAAGLGTALSQTQTDILNKVYYTNRVLSISTTTTVDPPATASAAYTQYTDIAISNGADLIVKDGDELVPDVLGLSTTTLPISETATNTGGRLRVGQITNSNANGAPNFPNGLTVTGIVTASTLNTTTNQIVVGSAVTANSQGIDVTGIVTATQFKGDGSVLTGIDASSLKHGSDVKVQANASGAVVTGVLTTTQYKPGEIIETIAAACDGRTVSVQSGNYTITDVTALQTGTTTYQDCDGSAINYTPPAGTKQLVYKYQFQWNCTGLSGLSHFRTLVDGTVVLPSQRSFSSNYASTNWNHGQFNWIIGYTFDLNGGASGNLSQGQFATGSWTSAKIIKTQFRIYNTSYTVNIHENNYWDGTTASGTNKAPIKPVLYIQAIA